MGILNMMPKKNMQVLKENGDRKNIVIIDNGNTFIITDLKINIEVNDRLIERFPNGNYKTYVVYDINYFESIGSLPKRYELTVNAIVGER